VDTIDAGQYIFNLVLVREKSAKLPFNRSGVSVLASEKPRSLLRARFATFEVNFSTGELFKHGIPIKLQRQPLEILRVLLERPGEVVSREEIRQRLWPDNTFVEYEDSLNTAIGKLRAALSDSSSEPRYFETVARRGYRFIGVIGEIEYAENNGFPTIEPKTPLPGPTREPHEGVVAASSATSPESANETVAGVPNLEPTVGANQPQTHRSARFWIVAAAFALLMVSAATIILSLLGRSSRLPFETVRTTRVTSTGMASKAVISPDGRYIAHTVLTGGQESLWIRQMGMFYDNQIVPAEPVRYLGLTFSPNSEMIYYVQRRAGDEPSTLFRIGAVGGSPQKVKGEVNSPVSFSPDGKEFAFMRETENESQLVIGKLDSDHERILTSRKLPEVLDYPAWSPDGRVVIFTEYASGIANATGSNVKLVEISVNDTTQRRVSQQTWGGIKKVAWLGDGHGLVMSARDPEESGLLHVWYVSYPDGVARKLTEGLSVEADVSASTDSRHVIAVQQNTFSSVWQAGSLQGHNAEPVVSGKSGSSDPLWTSDGRILFEEELQGQRSIWSVKADGSDRKQLTTQGNSYDFSLSRDGRKLAFVSDRSGVPAIWTADTDGGNAVMAARPIGETFSEESGPDISPDGEWLVFTSVGSGHSSTLWRTAAIGGKAAELNDKLWERPAISPDGKWIAGFYADRWLTPETIPNKIAVIASDGGQPVKVIPTEPSVLISGGIRWSANGRELYYINRGKDGDNVWRQPLHGGPPHQLTEFQGIELFSFDWSPDNRRLLFSRGVRSRDVVLIEDVTRR